jgi:hypothetical protein
VVAVDNLHLPSSPALAVTGFSIGNGSFAVLILGWHSRSITLATFCRSPRYTRKAGVRFDGLVVHLFVHVRSTRVQPFKELFVDRLLYR